MKSRRAIVLFGNTVGLRQHWLAPLLKEGFRHCSVAVEAGDYWVFVDPNPDCIRFQVPALKNYDLAGHFKNGGSTAIELNITGAEVNLPLVVSNCVGVVKTVFGIRRFSIITPYQLYKYLGRKEKHND